MESKELGKLTQQIKDKYPNAGVQRIELGAGDGKATFYLEPTKQVLATLEGNKAITPHIATGAASKITRNAVDRSLLDLGVATSPYNEPPHTSFERSIRYYYENDIYGQHIDILSNLASKGFENDMDDPNIKAFYDTWVFDVNFKQVLDWMFFDFFRVGMVKTYKIVGKYEPGITFMEPPSGTKPGSKRSANFFKAVGRRLDRRQKQALKQFDDLEASYKKNKQQLPKEFAAKKKMWSKGYMPISYTVLNPLLIEVDGSLLFDKSKITLQPSDELKDLLKKNPAELTEDEKEVIQLLPSEFKAQVEKGGGIVLDSLYVGSVDYRKQPYERYPRPRGIKVFDSLEYKNALRNADLSTLDGISNYILKITVGNDEFPVTDKSQLEAVAELFNTPSKAFDVVWNHTLQIEKVVSPEIEAILGKEKYAQVDMDITGGLGMSRAFFDGVGDVSESEVQLLIKTVIEEIGYARRQVTTWIYHEYQLIAEAAGFAKFPTVRWDQTILKDIILYMANISELVDRRMLSYETALEQLGFDYENELSNMKGELDLVMDGVFGIVGSPFQQTGIQPVQRAPKGTPSSGRPSGKPAKKKTKNTKPKAKVPNQAPSQQPKKAASLKDVVLGMNDSEYAAFVENMNSLRNDDD